MKKENLFVSIKSKLSPPRQLLRLFELHQAPARIRRQVIERGRACEQHLALRGRALEREQRADAVRLVVAEAVQHLRRHRLPAAVEAPQIGAGRAQLNSETTDAANQIVQHKGDVKGAVS